MERRKFVIGAGALATGSAAAMGTGAFSSVDANRDIKVESAEDSDALLAIEETSSENADEYVHTDNDGALYIDVTTDVGDGADGVNVNATTIIRDLFDITNRGSEDVQIWIEGSPDSNFFAGELPSLEEGDNVSYDYYVDDHNRGDPRAEWGVSAEPNGDPALIVEPGQTVEDVGVQFRDGFDADGFSEITVVAKAESDY